MKVKISVLLPQELLHTVDQYSGQYKSLSQFIEEALRVFLAQLMRQEQHKRDLVIINQCTDELNQETLDALTYQIPI